MGIKKWAEVVLLVIQWISGGCMQLVSSFCTWGDLISLFSIIDYFCYWNTLNIQYISFMCTTQWFDICVFCELLTTISLVTICHHTELMQIRYYWLYSPCCNLCPHDLLVLWLEICSSWSPSLILPPIPKLLPVW